MYSIQTISAGEAKAIVCKYHYSGKVVSNSKIHLGVFNPDKNLVGCLQYGYPMNGERTASKISPSGDMMELNRMVMADSEPKNAESMAIGACNKWLKKNTNLQWVLSFSDGKQNNVGYIYQATNWLYLGYLISDSFYELDGEIMHNVTVWHKYKEKHPDRNIKTTDQILTDNFNNVSKIKSKQHIYVMPLKKGITFYHNVKPYPKKDKEIPILERKIIKKNGILYNPAKVYKFSEEIYQDIFKINIREVPLKRLADIPEKTRQLPGYDCEECK